MDEKDSFEKICVVPNIKDFVDTTVSIIRKHGASAIVPKSWAIKHIRRIRDQIYNQAVLSTEIDFCDKLSKVIHEFPRRPSDPCILDYRPALRQVVDAIIVIRRIASDFCRLLLRRDDGYSLEQCNFLKVAAIGCMFTAAVRCIPSLDYLDKVRQYMTESNLGDENAAFTCTLKHGHILAQEDCTVPHTFDVDAAADFVHPEVVTWLWELEREYGWRIKDDQLDSAKLSHNPEVN